MQKLSEDIAECHTHAAQCRTRAKRAIDPKIKQEYLDMERRWLSMARSHEFAEQLLDFTDKVRRQPPGALHWSEGEPCNSMHALL